ncbi:hypothetical protein Hypma_008498 [Hypsizygus marmoreus]|uniref:Uncharacterized protein n=1 Tax=Hypsizygus marmoreus TaxID=39966 RepID=A0A369JQ80_HYPMA|nr:hypothetical protein Hypma_008498 [Hypsizygus marmoreus]
MLPLSAQLNEEELAHIRQVQEYSQLAVVTPRLRELKDFVGVAPDNRRVVERCFVRPSPPARRLNRISSSETIRVRNNKVSGPDENTPPRPYALDPNRYLTSGHAAEKPMSNSTKLASHPTNDLDYPGYFLNTYPRGFDPRGRVGNRGLQAQATPVAPRPLRDLTSNTIRVSVPNHINAATFEPTGHAAERHANVSSNVGPPVALRSADEVLNTLCARVPTTVLSNLPSQNTRPSASTPRVRTGGIVLDRSELELKLTLYPCRPSGFRGNTDDNYLPILGSHFTIWDKFEQGCVFLPAQLNLVVKNPKKWSEKQLSIPDIRGFDLLCENRLSPALASGVPYSGKSDLDKGFKVNYSGGATVRVINDMLTPFVPWRGIAFEEPGWVYMPGEGEGDRHLRHGVDIGQRGWFIRVWIPLPMRLFRKKEARVLTLKAVVRIGKEQPLVYAMIPFSVSHLLNGPHI